MSETFEQYKNRVNKINLYHEFLAYLLNNDKGIDYIETLKKLGLKNQYKIVGTPRQDAYNLLAWIDECNNGKIPECLQVFFNEFVLERI